MTQDIIKPILKNCPFCGSQAEFKSRSGFDEGEYYTFVKCLKCWCKSKEFPNEIFIWETETEPRKGYVCNKQKALEDSANEWNTRVEKLNE